MQVQLSYEERILNALMRVEDIPNEGLINRMTREHAAIRRILQPLYDEIDELRK